MDYAELAAAQADELAADHVASAVDAAAQASVVSFSCCDQQLYKCHTCW